MIDGRLSLSRCAVRRARASDGSTRRRVDARGRRKRPRGARRGDMGARARARVVVAPRARRTARVGDGRATVAARRPRDRARARYAGSGTYDSFDEVDGASDGDDPSRVAFDRAEWHTQTLAKRSKDLLKSADSSGIWTVGTTALVFVIAGFESLEAEAVTRGVELVAVLPSYVPRDVAPALADGGIERAESCLQAIFLFEYVVRAWSEGFQLRYLRSPVALIDFLSLLPTFGLLLSLVGIGGAGFGATEQFRPLRLFRVLRLLRVLDLSDGGNDELAGDNASIDARRKRREKTQNEKVFAVAVEFLCVFLISGELFYDLEVDTNPNISDVGDAIYWSFLTLTGIGQPFEATTAQGRVATVVSILTALVVVPLQLAVLVSAQTEAQAQVGGGAITGVPPTTRTAIGLGAPVYVPREPPSDDAQLSRMVSDAGSDFWQGTMDEDSAWLRLREREELRDARKKIKSQEITISALRMENKKLRGALEDADLLGTIDIADSFEEDITA